MTVYLYRLKNDNGSAPNIQGGVCSLAICKPKIRCSAKPGDIIIGLRGRSGPIGKLGPEMNSVLYVMKITKKMTFAEYYEWCKTTCPEKIASVTNPIGDCQYMLQGGDLVQMACGPHGQEHREKDIGGKYVLIAENTFWYRSDPVGVQLDPLLTEMWSVKNVGRGHRVIQFSDTTGSCFQDWYNALHVSCVEMNYGRKTGC